MATGDIAGNIEALRGELSSIRYSQQLNSVRAQAGDPTELLPILSYALLRFSRHVALLVAEHGYQLQGKTDQRFVETAWKFARDVLGIKTVLTPAQFLSEGYAERKLLLLRQVIRACKDHHNAAARKERLAALKGTHSEQKLYGGGSGGAQRRCGSQSPEPASKCKPPHVSVVSALTLPPAVSTAGMEGKGSLSAGEQAGEEAVKGQHEPASCPAAAVAGGRVFSTCGSCEERAQPGNTLPPQTDAAAPPAQKAAASPAASDVEQPRPLPALLAAPHSVQIPQLQGWRDTGQAAAATPTMVVSVADASIQPRVSPQLIPLQPPGAAWQQQPAPQAISSGPAPSLATASTTGLLASSVPASLGGTVAPGQLGQLGPLHTVASYSQVNPSPFTAAPRTVSSWAPPSASMPAASCPQQLTAIQPSPLQPGPEASCLPWQQQQQQQQAMAQQLLVQQPQSQLGYCSGGMPDPAVRRLVEDLQLRLHLAEEAVLGVRHAAEQAQEAMQGRIAVLEGRVKFLESGFALQPLAPKPLQLPWPSPPRSQQHQEGTPAARPASPDIAAHRAPQQQQQQQQQAARLAPVPSGSTAGSNIDSGELSRRAGANAALGGSYVPVSLQHAPRLLLPSSGPSGAACSSSMPGSAIGVPGPVPGNESARSTLLSGRAGGSEGKAAVVQRSFSNTSELINSMHSRFSEAEEFLRSMQRH